MGGPKKIGVGIKKYYFRLRINGYGYDHTDEYYQ